MIAEQVGTLVIKDYRQMQTCALPWSEAAMALQETLPVDQRLKAPAQWAVGTVYR
jgi:hypothetical protein